MTAKSTLIELSKRLSDIESLIGHVDKDVADDRNSEMTLETRGHNIRKFLNTFGVCKNYFCSTVVYGKT